mgnify:CR=1 FL=1
MSVFKEHKTIADRAASDRSRHREKIEKAIKESIRDVVAEESIIGQNGKKKIRIPVKGIKEHRFVYGNNEKNKRVGSAPGKDLKEGQRIGHKRKRTQSGNKPGNKPGEEMYEIEMSLEELAGYLFDDLKLPELEKKNFKFTTQEKMKRKGKRPYGIRPRLSKKETIKQKLKRKKAAIKAGTFDPEGGERFTFHESDLRYKHIAPVIKENTAAVIFFVMDVSGSMTKSKKFLARSFFFLLYQFLNHRYSSIDVVFPTLLTHTKLMRSNSLLRFLMAALWFQLDSRRLKKLLIKDIILRTGIYTPFIAVMGTTGLSITRRLLPPLEDLKK